MERRITSLGKQNIAKMKLALNYGNINQIIEHYGIAPRAKKYSNDVDVKL